MQHLWCSWEHVLILMKTKIINNIILYIDSFSLFYILNLYQTHPEFHGYFYVIYFELCGNHAANLEKEK